MIARFNGYLAACGVAPGQPVSGPLPRLMAQQHKRYIQWRKAMLGKMASLPGFAQCSAQDQADLLLADREFGKEVACFEAWRRNRGQQEFDEPPAVPEWQAIAGWWEEAAPPAAMADLLAHCVHDSRAWFKPLGKDVPDLQQQMEALALQAEQERAWAAAYPYADYPNPYALLPRQREALMHYLDYPKRGDGPANPGAGLPIETGGREPLWLGAGYLRYRKIYMGSDSYKPADAIYAGLASPADRRLMSTPAWQPGQTSWA